MLVLQIIHVVLPLLLSLLMFKSLAGKFTDVNCFTFLLLCHENLVVGLILCSQQSFTVVVFVYDSLKLFLPDFFFLSVRLRSGSLSLCMFRPNSLKLSVVEELLPRLIVFHILNFSIVFIDSLLHLVLLFSIITVNLILYGLLFRSKLLL